MTLRQHKNPEKMSEMELRNEVKFLRAEAERVNVKAGKQLRWLKSKAFISNTDYFVQDNKDTYRWMITFTSSCRTIENALNQAMNRDREGLK